jgi:hypothetical protein
MNRTIYDISADLAALESILHENGGDVSDPQAEAALAEWERELELDLTGKVDRYCSLIAELEARSKSRQAEADRLADLAKADDKAAQGLRERLRFIWETRNLPKIETSRFRVALTRNGGKAPLDLRVEPDELPEWAIDRKTIVTANKDAIRARLEAGENLPFANLMERGTRISIK